MLQSIRLCCYSLKKKKKLKIFFWSSLQVLVAANVAWVPVTEDNIPPNALPCGHNESGEPLFSGRVNHEGTLTLGKVQASHKVLYIPYGGDEISYSEYEVLVLN